MDRLERRRMEVAAEAHLAAEARLEMAYLVMAAEEGQLDDDVSADEIERAAAQLAGPFCGCHTCIIREVLHAAEPHMNHLAALEYHHN